MIGLSRTANAWASRSDIGEDVMVRLTAPTKALLASKVQIMVEHTGETFSVLFNPEEYTLNKDNNFASQAIPGLSGPILQFVHGNMRTLEMELFFDTYDTDTLPKQDVRDLTNR